MRLGAWGSTRQRTAATWFRLHLQQQFGQSHDDAVWDGRTACTHTVWQKIIGFVKGRVYTLNEINTLAGMPYKAKATNGAPRGMRPSEAQHLIAKVGIPYEVLYGASFATLRARAKLGPVMYAMRYGSAPEWKGHTYNGVRASAPFALSGGKTQLTGFEDGRHAVVLIAERKRLSETGRVKTVALRSRLRSAPKTTSTVVQVVPKGTTLVVLGRVTGSRWTLGAKTGTTWFKVRRLGSSRDLYVATVLCSKVTYPVIGTVIYRQEPNHGSGVRPERPPYDIITVQQAEAEYLAYHAKLGQRLTAFVPKD